MSNNVRQIPPGRGLRRVERNGGEAFNVADARLTWKAKGQDTGHAFSIFEQQLGLGEGVPLHCHAYGEVFYVLDGEVDFLRVDDAGEDWIVCSGGETVIVPSNALHAFYNRTDKPARLLSIASPLHQAFFDALAESDRADPFSSMPRPQAMMRVAELSRQFDLHFFPFEPPARRQ
jgi:quercetin dioxygenase-like cupin family protein